MQAISRGKRWELRSLKSDPSRSRWRGKPDPQDASLRVLEEHNEQIVRTAIPFEYEPLDHPHLKRLREQCKLDEVVQGAHTELELLLRLAQWACNAWDWPKHITEN